LIRTLRRIQGPFREFGFAAGCLYAMHRVLQGISARWQLHVYEITVQPIAERPVGSRKRGSKLEMREIRAGDPEIALMPVRPEVMLARIRQNAACLGAFRNGELIGYMWFCRREYEEDEVRCIYVLEDERESVFDFDFYLYPKHRMGVAFVALWNAANEFLSGQGIRYTFSRLTRFNVASRRAHQHLGCRVIGRVLFLQLGRLEAMLATLAPYASVSMSASRRVRLKLRPDVPRT
jgi:hypothetical protein